MAQLTKEQAFDMLKNILVPIYKNDAMTAAQITFACLDMNQVDYLNEEIDDVVNTLTLIKGIINKGRHKKKED